MNSKNNSQDRDLKFIFTLGIALIATLATAFLLYKYISPELDDDNTPEENQPVSYPEITVYENRPDNVIATSANLTLPEGWEVTTKLKGNQLEQYLCMDEEQRYDECNISIVKKDAYEFYVSSTGFLNLGEFDPTEITEEEFVINGENVTFMYEKVEVIDDIENIEETSSYINQEIYGCYENICFSSGLLDSEKGVNQGQTEAFEAMVTGISFEEKDDSLDLPEAE